MPPIDPKFGFRLIRPLRRSSLSLYATGHHCMPRDMPRDITVFHGTSLYAEVYLFEERVLLASIYIKRRSVCVCVCVCVCLSPKISQIYRFTPKFGFKLIWPLRRSLCGPNFEFRLASNTTGISSFLRNCAFPWNVAMLHTLQAVHNIP